jgi:hypothetical protein
VGNRNFLKAIATCTAVFALRDGDLMAATNTSPGAATTTGAVVGGTGAYAGASGVLVSTKGNDTITLAG